jgi:hypothetical protein
LFEAFAFELDKRIEVHEHSYARPCRRGKDAPDRAGRLQFS